MSKVKEAIAKAKGKTQIDFTPEGLRNLFVSIAYEIILDKFSEIEKEMVDTIEKRIEPLLLKKLKGERGEKGASGIGLKGEKGDSIVGPRGLPGPKGRDYILTQRDQREIADLIPMPEDGKDGSSDTSEQVVNKINSSRKKIKISTIDGLEVWLRNLMRAVKEKPSQIMRGGGDIVRAYDLSDSLNGVLKTFTIPTNRRVLGVRVSSFPFALRPTTDFTYTANSITFTSEISVDSTLATGQTLIVEYIN